MKNTSSWSFKHHFLLSLGVTIIVSISDLITIGFGVSSIIDAMAATEKHGVKDAAAIGIIGGADGPTAVFISGNPFIAFLYSKIVFLTILLILFMPTRKFISMRRHN